MLSRPAQIGSEPSEPPNPPNLATNPYSASRGGGGADAGDATMASAYDRAPWIHHSSATVQMLENALAAVRDDASQLPRSDLAHASAMIQDLQSMLRERLSRNLGDEETANSEELQLAGKRPGR